MNITDLRTYVRDLTGIYATSVVSDALIDRWLGEAYDEVARYRDWDWLEIGYVFNVGDDSTWVNLDPNLGYHRFDIDFAEAPGENYGRYPSKQVLSVYLTSANGNFVKEIRRVPNFDHLREGDEVVYDIVKDHSGVATEQNTYLRVSPKQPDNYYVRVRVSYDRFELVFTDYSEDPATTTELPPAFHAQFHPILAYRAAVKVLQFANDDSNRSEYYMAEYNNLLDGMVSYYENDHDVRSFQLGEEGVNTRVFFPWFRPS